MIAQSAMEMTGSSASRGLGRKMDSIPFSAYHALVISVLALVGFIEGYDLFMTGSLLVLAKVPLHLTETDNQWLLLGPALMGTIGGFGFSAVGESPRRSSFGPAGANGNPNQLFFTAGNNNYGDGTFGVIKFGQ